MVMTFILGLLVFIAIFPSMKIQKKSFWVGGVKTTDDISRYSRMRKVDEQPSGRKLFANGTAKKQMNTHKDISDILDNLLSGYDNRIRPNFGGPPAVVEVDIMVRSMGPISEIDMTYSMDLYFRQSWVDKRLAFTGNKDTLALSITMLEKIWKPDTYFYNGKQSYLHTITTPNKFVRLYQDGRVLYSSRLTIKAGCPMNLENFPMDTQRCPLKFGSFGYMTNDVIYKWNSQRQIVIAEDMKLSQFDLIDNISANQTDVVSVVHSQVFTVKEYSMLLVSFHLQRHMGNFLIQVYGPCILLVVLSWVSFWLNREATADRVSLGITTVLTMTFLGLEARTDLPKVPYPTALDFFVFLSFAFIFATIIQFAVVHYFTKYGSGECYFGMDLNSDSGSEDEETQGRQLRGDDLRNHKFVEFIPLSSYTVPSVRRKEFKKPGFFRTIKNLIIGESNSIPFERSINLRCSDSSQASRTTVDIEGTKKIPPTRDKCAKFKPKFEKTGESNTSQTRFDVSSQKRKCDTRQRSIGSLSENVSQAFYGFRSPRSTLNTGNVKRRKRRIPRCNSVSKIDKISRIVFPLLFAIINVLYWYSYLIRSERINREY